MKLFIASDIHGSAYYCEKMLEAREREGSPRMLLLGDLLYHGPRNDLPEDYAPKKVIAMLNPLKDDILCVRGNCEAEVDQMVLDFPVMADYCLLPLISRKKAEDGGNGILYDTGHVMFCTHGHVWHEKNLPPLRPGDLLLHGHTHIPGVKRAGDIMILNPGSVSIPKEGSAHSCAVLEDGIFSLKTLGGETYLEQDLDFL
jgi:putative phosphoesterase